MKIKKKKLDVFTESLGLVEGILDFEDKASLDNVVFLGAQHILPSTFRMFKSFIDRGLSPKNIFLIGKCYSTDLKTFDRFKEIGSYVCPSSIVFDKASPYDFTYVNNVKNFVSRIVSSKFLDSKTVVVLDDGGEVLSQINASKCNDCTIVGLEQTSSGYEKIKGLNLNIPVVNVARSKAKLVCESPVIIETAVRELYKKIRSRNLRINKVAVMGNGAVGSSMASALEGSFDVYTFDINSEKGSTFSSSANLCENLMDVDLIIGCTGTTVLTINDLKVLKKGTTLTSLSSSDREFDLVVPRSQSLEVDGCHKDFSWNGLTFLNCGFPLNFNGCANDVDPEKFELTRALLSLAILQSLKLKSSGSGIYPLNETGQDLVVSLFRSKYLNYTSA